MTGPVSDDSNFYGRRDEAIDLARKLQRGQIRSCLGIRKIGKTSIINRVLREIQKSHLCTCVMADCSRDDVWDLNAAQLLNSIAKTAEKSIREQRRYATLDPIKDGTSLNAARSALETLLLSTDTPFVLVFDEIDYVTPGSPTNLAWTEEFNPFWRNLRAAYQESTRQARAFSILVAGVSTHWFTVESIRGVENAALAFVPEEYLSPMPTGATIAMLRRLGKIAGLTIQEGAAEMVAKATGNMPYWARKCCSYISRQVPVAERPCDIRTERVSPLVDAFVRDEGAAIAEVALHHLFRVHPDLKSATELCSLGRASQVAERHKRALRKYGVLLLEQDVLAGQMIATAFGGLLAAEQPTVAVSAVPPQNTRLSLQTNEWAEEIAVAGKRRNIIEKKLRELVLNFLRFHLMNAGKLPELQQRIARVLPEKQRNGLAHMNAEQLLGKFTWTDLTKLVTSEWELLEKLFGDKTQFQKNCDLVNDRFDAHAKPADLADLALYRRALDYIEDRLAKVQ